MSDTPLIETRPNTELLEKIEVQKPRLYQVVLLNDQFTTFDFVVYVLVRFFGKTKSEAQVLTERIHNNERAVAGVFSKDEAETKAKMVVECARANKFPLLCEAEPVE